MRIHQKLSQPKNGFTLIEMIAVMAIVAILASAIAPNIVSELRRARSDAEDATLSNLSKLLTEAATRKRHLPGTNTWMDSIASLSDLPAANIRTNSDNFPRVYVIDPAWTPLGSRPAPAGWTQTPAAAWALVGATPANCRILMLSGSRQNLTPLCAAPTALQFDQIWNGTGGPPACLEGVDVRIGRTNLTKLFHQVTLNASAPGHFGFNWKPAAPNQAFAAGTRTFPILDGTRLSLLDGAGTTILTEAVVNRPLAANWDGATWTVP